MPESIRGWPLGRGDWVDGGVPFVTGAIVGGVSLWQLLHQPNTPLTTLITVAAVLGIAVPLVGGGAWFLRTDRFSAANGRIGAWCLAGMIPIMGFAVAAVGYQYANGNAVNDPVVLTIWFAGGGALGGLITGIYDVRQQEEHAAVKRREQELERSYGLLAKTEQLAEAGGWVLDGQTEALRWTAGTRQIFDIPEDDEPTLQEAVEFYHPEDRATIQSRIETCRATGEPYDEELRIITADGEERWVRSVGEPVTEDGEIVMVRGAIVDITDQKVRTEQLRRFKQAANSTKDLLAVVDEDYRYLFANPRYCEYHDIDQDAIEEYVLADVFDEEEYSEITQYIDRASSGEVIRYQMTRLHPARGERWLDIYYQPLTDEDDRVQGVVVAMRDITERIERKQELQLFQRVVEEAGHSVLITDRDGTIKYVNPAYEETSGYTREEALGRNPRIVKSGKQSERFYEELWETILSGRVWDSDLINQRKSGELYHVEQTIAPITNDDGDITHFVAIESDISDRRLREQRLSVLNRILRHNLRNAITAIKGNATLLYDALTDDDLQSRAAAIAERAAALNSISEDAATVEALFERELDIEPTCKVGELLTELAADFEDAYPDAVVTVTVPDGVSVKTDERLGMAIREAVDNAVTHNDQTPPEVTVSVTSTETSDSDGWTTIEIADNGPGIPEAEQTVIEMGEETSLFHGSGIGVWLIYWVMASFGGEVSFRENDPRGSVVTLRFPTAPM